MVEPVTPTPDNPFQTRLNSTDPATVFISYHHDDHDLAERVERALQIRGGRVSRDRPTLFVGQDSVEGLTDLIKYRCDAIIFIVTPNLLGSDFVWRHEVPTAVSRWGADHRFGIIPLMHGVSKTEIDDFCLNRNVKSLGDFNFEKIKDDGSDAATIRTIALRTLQSAFFLRRARDLHDPEILVASIHTFPFIPAGETLHLDVDWREPFAGTGPTPTEWESELLPALRDMSDTVANMGGGRSLDLWVKARLPTGMAIGYMFPIKGSVNVRLCNSDFVWDTRGTIDPSLPLSVNQKLLNREDQAATIEIAISRSIFDDIATWRNYVSTDGKPYTPKWRAQFTPTTGIGGNSLPNDGVARSAARQIGNAIHQLWDSEGVGDIHIFLSSPIEFAVMLGQHLRDRRRIHVYYGDSGHGFERAYTIDPEVIR